MEIKYLKLNDIPSFEGNLVACIGYFDGLHKGHLALINKVKEISTPSEKRTLITFYPDPKDVISSKQHKHIQSFDERLRIIDKMGIELCLIFEFTKELCQTSQEDFYLQILAKLPLKALVCGFDFHYGHMGSGDYHSLKAMASFPVYMIEEVDYLQKKISTSRLKEALSEGDITLVNELLPYKYYIVGLVIKGKRIGHKIGFPTANITLNEEVLYPKVGVYLGYVKYQDKYYKAMINIGFNETISLNNQLTIEAHILDFNQDIYGEKVIIYFNEYLRDNRRFDNLDLLKKQLSIDVTKAKNQIEYESKF